MSFELKPTGSTKPPPEFTAANFCCLTPSSVLAWMPTMEEITWSCAKSPAPALLAGRVPDDVWASTFDAVYARSAEQMEWTRKFMEGRTGVVGFLRTCPCCLPCEFVMHCFDAQAESQQKQAWRKLAQDEQQKYAPFGVQITIVMEVSKIKGIPGHDPSSVHHGVHGNHTGGGGSTTVSYVGLKFDTAAPTQGQMTRDAGA